MLNEKLIHYAAAILLNRYTYWKNAAKESFAKGKTEIGNRCDGRAGAYRSAYDILWYAINDNEECMKEFDYYAD